MPTRNRVSPPPPGGPSSPRVIGPEAARRVLLAAQGLSKPPARRSGPASLAALVHRLGFVQVDSINVVERAHHLIIHTRLDAHRPANLARLLERDPVLFEHWTHDASVIPLEFHPHWRPRFRRYAERLDRRDWWRERLGGDDPREILDRVLERVRTDGPLRGRDLEEERASDGGGPWWNWHPGKAALEHHWRTGRLAIARREGFEKVYDLVERVHPQTIDDAEPDHDAHLEWACRSALDRLGVATASEVAAFWASISVADARRWCDAAVQSGELEPIVLDDLDGRRRRGYATEASRRLERIAPWNDECRILCPFDPVIRDRHRLARRFDFEYRFEAFTPAAKRRYGYYTMPILHGDRFTGRIDPKFDRDAGELRVRGPWWEPGHGGRADRRRLDRALDRLVGWLGADGWSFTKA